jgi:hypothetical protein
MINLKPIKQLIQSRLSRTLTVFSLIVMGAGLKVQASIWLGQVAPMSPADALIYQAIPGSHWLPEIETAVLNILKTPTGQSFCSAAGNNKEVMRRLFFITEASARKAMALCDGKMMPFRNLPLHKKYFVITSKEPNMQATGWTSPSNETFLFINLNEPLRNQIYSILAHEIAISMDQKEQIGYLGVLDFPDIGLIKDEASCQVLPSLREPLIKHTFSTLRAFEVEAAIMKELNLESDIKNMAWGQIDCVQKFKFMHSYISKMNHAFDAESLISQLMQVPSTCENPSTERLSVDEKAKLISQTQLTFNTGLSVNACEFMSRGLPFFAGVSFHGGPGPRIGSGWKDLEPREGSGQIDSMKKEIENLRQQQLERTQQSRRGYQ